MRPARLRSEVTTGCYTEPLVHLRVRAGDAGAYHPDYAVKDTYYTLFILSKKKILQLWLSIALRKQVSKHDFITV